MRFEEIGVNGSNYHDRADKDEYEADNDKAAPSCLDKVDLLGQQNLSTKISAYTDDEQAKAKCNEYKADWPSKRIARPLVIVVSRHDIAVVIHVR